MENHTTTTTSSLNFDYTIINSTQAAPSKPKIEQVRLNLRFNTITTTIVSDHENNIIQAPSQSQDYSEVLLFDTNMDPATMHETISMELARWALPEQTRQHLIGQILFSMREMVKSISPKRNLVLDADCVIILEQHHDIIVSDVMDWIIQQTFAENVHNMVPASDSSIEALKRTIIVDGSCESCSVCLEDFPAGCEVLCMPCWHAFHHDCIRKWLSSSHYCPNCRYEMPTS